MINVAHLNDYANDNLEELVNFNAFQHHAFMEDYRITNYQIKKLLKLCDENEDIFAQFSINSDDIKKVISKSTEGKCNDLSMCIKKIQFDQNSNEAKVSAVDIKILYIYYFIKEVYKEKTFIDNIQIVFNDTLYYYPGYEFNSSFKRKENEMIKKIISEEGSKNYFNLYKNNSIFLDSANASSYIIQNNPFPYIYDKRSYSSSYIDNNKKESVDTIQLSIVSLKYQKKEEIISESSAPEIDEYIKIDANMFYLKTFLPQLTANGTLTITLTLTRDGEFLSKIPCYYLIKEYNIENSNFTDLKKYKINSVQDCILNQEAKMKFSSYYNEKVINSISYERKTNLNLISNGRLMQKFSKNYSWRIIYSRFPLFSSILDFTNFIYNYGFSSFLFKEISDLTGQANEIYCKYFYFFSCILFLFIFMCPLVLSIFSIVAYKTIYSQFIFISKLTKIVKQFISTKHKEAIVNFKELKSPEDHDLNHLLESSKHILFGGSNEEDEEESFNHQKEIECELSLNRVYNSISRIKKNNLIIKDEEMYQKNTNNIFNYDPRDFKTKLSRGLSRGISRVLTNRSLTNKRNIGDSDIFNQDDLLIFQEDNENEIRELIEEQERTSEAKGKKKGELENLFDLIAKNVL